MTLREFLRFHLLKALLILVALQVIVIAIIQNFNHRPVAERDFTAVIEDRTVKITPLTNDSDKDEEDELEVLNVSEANSGAVEQSRNLIYYTPEPGFIGVDSFAYTISDGKKESNEGFVVIQVNENLEPIALADTTVVYRGGITAIDVLGNDTDRESDSLFVAEYTEPLHGQLTQKGNKLLYTASNTSAAADSFHYVLSDGKSSTAPVSVYIGLKSRNNPCYPWMSLDIGDYAIPGKTTCKGNSMLIEASGSDIWNNVSGLRYVYQYISGDCEMSAKVESIEAGHEWAKAAIMVRETLSGNSKSSMVLMANDRGARSQNRYDTNGGMSGSSPEDVEAPYWIKLVRKGDKFTYFISNNGRNWKEIDSQENVMSEDVYIGFGFTSHDNNELAKTVFSNYQLKATAVK